MVGFVGAVTSFADEALDELLDTLLELLRLLLARLEVDEVDFDELLNRDELLATEDHLELLESDRLLEDRDDVDVILDEDFELLVFITDEVATDDLLLATSLGVVKVLGSPCSERVLFASRAIT